MYLSSTVVWLSIWVISSLILLFAILFKLGTTPKRRQNILLVQYFTQQLSGRSGGGRGLKTKAHDSLVCISAYYLYWLQAQALIDIGMW
jgi:hypothetical protein